MEPLRVVLTSEQAAYIAGLVDGEGTIGFNRVPSPHGKHRLTWVGRVSIINTHLETLEWVQSVVGFGSIQSRKSSAKWKMCYQVSWVSRQSRALLPILLPYLRIKRKQAELVLAYLQRQYHAGLKRGLPLAEWEARSRIASQVYALNRRGPALEEGAGSSLPAQGGINE